MITLSVVVKDREQPITLFFDKREDAEAVTKDSFFGSVEDSYGASLTLDPNMIIGLLINDALRAVQAEGKVAYIRAGEQAELQRRAAHSPKIAGFGSVINQRGGLVG